MQGLNLDYQCMMVGEVEKLMWKTWISNYCAFHVYLWLAAQIKYNEAADPSVVVSEMLKASAESGQEWVADVCNAVVKDGKTLEDWSKTWLASVYKGKGDTLECDSYWSINTYWRPLKHLLRCKWESYGFIGGNGTTDAIFIVRQMQEKYQVPNYEALAYMQLRLFELIDLKNLL